MKHELINLNYSYYALEPFIDSQTMEIHHSKHHQTYVNNLNKALESFPEFSELSLEGLMLKLSSLSGEGTVAVKNNAGGVYNHNFFFSGLKKNNGEVPQNKLIEKIEEKFGSIDNFKEEFTKAAISRFGSGWAWLVINKSGELEIVSTANQDSPFSDGMKPVITLDVWEHAYYLKYQNRRAEYIQNWWNVVDWEKASEIFEKSI